MDQITVEPRSGIDIVSYAELPGSATGTIVSSPSDNFSDNFAEIRRYLARPRLINDVVWSSSHESGFTLAAFNLPYVSFMSRYQDILNKIQMFKYFKCDMKISVRCNGSPMHFGSVVLGWNPLETDVSSHIDWNARANVVSACSARWAALEADDTSEVSLTIPWFSPREALSFSTRNTAHTTTMPEDGPGPASGVSYFTAMSDPDLWSLGTLRLYVLNNLRRIGQTADHSLNLLVYVSLENVELHTPTVYTPLVCPIRLNMMYPHVATGSIGPNFFPGNCPTKIEPRLNNIDEATDGSPTQASYDDLVTPPAPVYVRQAKEADMAYTMNRADDYQPTTEEVKTLDGVDREANFMSAGGIIGRAIANNQTERDASTRFEKSADEQGGLGETFNDVMTGGWSKPNTKLSSTMFKPAIFDTAYGVGLELAKVLSPNGTCGISPLPFFSGMDMNFDDIQSQVQRVGLLQTVSWTTQMNAGDYLFTIPVTPSRCFYTTEPAIPDSPGFLVPTPAAWFSRIAELWRGDMEYMLRVVCSRFHTGRLCLYWSPDPEDPNVTLPTAMARNPSIALDIAQLRGVSTTVPWVGSVGWKATSPFQDSRETSTVAAKSDSTYNGYLICRVLQPLRSNSELDDFIYLNLFSKAGPNMELSRPIQNPQGYALNRGGYFYLRNQPTTPEPLSSQSGLNLNHLEPEQPLGYQRQAFNVDDIMSAPAQKIEGQTYHPDIAGYSADKISSLKNLLARPRPVNGFVGTTFFTTTPESGLVVDPTPQLPWSALTNGVINSTLAVPDVVGEAMPADLWTHLSLAFVGWRGSANLYATIAKDPEIAPGIASSTTKGSVLISRNTAARDPLNGGAIQRIEGKSMQSHLMSGATLGVMEVDGVAQATLPWRSQQKFHRHRCRNLEMEPNTVSDFNWRDRDVFHVTTTRAHTICLYTSLADDFQFICPAAMPCLRM